MSDDEGGDVIPLRKREAELEAELFRDVAPEGVEHLTELGHAHRLVRLHGDDLRYCWPWRRWLVWDGSRWRVDDSGEAIARAKQTVKTIYAEASSAKSSDARRAIAEFAKRCESSKKLAAALELAASEPGIPVSPEDLDRDPFLFACANGTLDLRTGRMHPHRQEDRLTKTSPIPYDPRALAPTWRAFLARVLPDDSARRFVQRSVGYSMTGSVREQCFFLLWGRGRNGKSTFVEAIRYVLGEHAIHAPAETFIAQRETSVPNDVARLRGARFASAIETVEAGRLDETKLKALTGGDRVVARHMRADWFEFAPTFKLWLATNHRPQVRGTDLAIWRRVRLVPFTQTLTENEVDPDLPEKLRAEAPGILAWAVRGCLDWQENGLQAPKSVVTATDAYREEEDVLRSFLDDECVVNENARVAAADLYDRYRSWAVRSGEHPVSQRLFGDRLSERGFDRKRGSGGRWLRVGLGLVQKESSRGQ